MMMSSSLSTLSSTWLKALCLFMTESSLPVQPSSVVEISTVVVVMSPHSQGATAGNLTASSLRIFSSPIFIRRPVAVSLGGHIFFSGFLNSANFIFTSVQFLWLWTLMECYQAI